MGQSFDLISPTRNFKIIVPNSNKKISPVQKTRTNSNLRTEKDQEEQNSLDVGNLYNNTIANLNKNNKDRSPQISIVDFVNSDIKNK